MGPLLGESGGKLRIEVDDNLWLSFPEKYLRSIVYNPISNALIYRHPDRSPVVRLNCRTEAGYLLLGVEDNGLGISGAQQGRLFEMFSRFHTHVEGSGLGLYM